MPRLHDWEGEWPGIPHAWVVGSDVGVWHSLLRWACWSLAQKWWSERQKVLLMLQGRESNMLDCYFITLGWFATWVPPLVQGYAFHVFGYWWLTRGLPMVNQKQMHILLAYHPKVSTSSHYHSVLVIHSLHLRSRLCKKAKLSIRHFERLYYRH